MLTDTEKHYLLDVARHALKEEICGSGEAPPALVATPTMSRKYGAFVTLNEGDELRGCLGLLESDLPLPATIAMMARRSATEDPRFPAVSPDEVDGLAIELSILSPFAKIASETDIMIGTHGLLIQRGMKRGLLLPQVAVKHHFTVTQFLEEVCMKAGLPRRAWMDPETELFTFTAEVIEEGDR